MQNVKESRMRLFLLFHYQFCHKLSSLLGGIPMNDKTVVSAYKNFWREIFNFSGTEDRFEFWVPFLINAFFSLVTTSFVTFITGKTINETNNIFIFIPLFFF